MKKSQFTPGPWSASLDMDGRHHHLAIMTEAPRFKQEEWPYHPKIAVVYHGLGHADRKTAEASARLIAAAPELLWALQQIANMPGGTIGSVLTLAKETARAAIAKATGASKTEQKA